MNAIHKTTSLRNLRQTGKQRPVVRKALRYLQRADVQIRFETVRGVQLEDTSIDVIWKEFLGRNLTSDLATPTPPKNIFQRVGTWFKSKSPWVAAMASLQTAGFITPGIQTAINKALEVSGSETALAVQSYDPLQIAGLVVLGVFAMGGAPLAFSNESEWLANKLDSNNPIAKYLRGGNTFPLRSEFLTRTETLTKYASACSTKFLIGFQSEITRDLGYSQKQTHKALAHGINFSSDLIFNTALLFGFASLSSGSWLNPDDFWTRFSSGFIFAFAQCVSTTTLTHWYKDNPQYLQMYRLIPGFFCLMTTRALAHPELYDTALQQSAIQTALGAFIVAGSLLVLKPQDSSAASS